MNWKKLIKNWRVVLLLVFLIFSIITIQPQFSGSDSVTIRSVVPNSSAANAGIPNPSAKVQPLAKEKILAINGQKIDSVETYYSVVQSVSPNTTLRIQTDKAIYTALTSQSKADLGLKVYQTPTSNLRKGLDLEGGTRVLLKPQEEVSDEDMDSTIASLKERLNVYGLSDVVVRRASDLEGNDFILIEIAGVTEEEVQNVLARQGKFEAKIGNETVFFGGKKDITYVCRSADCSGINPNRGCAAGGEGTICSFFFAITLSPEAAERQASLTKDLSISPDSSQYLSEDLRLFLDDKEVDSLKIGTELRGRATTNIQISGSGSGRTEQEAVTNTLESMKRLQTIIITGSLPVKLEIAKVDTISPSLGQEFLRNIFLVGLFVILAVTIVILVRYRTIKVVVPMILTLLSEMVLILGFASLIGWNLDLAAIAGILIVAGTGVDHLIIITDETIKGEVIADWKKKVKRAMFIVMGAYFTTMAGMLPLLSAGAGLLKGFALTTIAGISFGVLIARPAFAAIIEELLK